MNDIIKRMKKAAKNEYARTATEGFVGDDAEFIDTGCYVLNAMLSGSVYGGYPANCITTLAGEPSTGKTYFALGACDDFLTTKEDSAVCYFESEKALVGNNVATRVAHSDNFLNLPVATVEEWNQQALNILNDYKTTDEADRTPIMMVLDSLGNLSSIKETTDIAAGDNKVDFTRAKAIRAAFRTITLKVGLLGVPVIVTNHVYDDPMNVYAGKKQGGGKGGIYASDIIVFLTKIKPQAKDEIDKKDGTYIKCFLEKSRYTREKSEVTVKLMYDTGLDRYYGLLDLADEAGIFKKLSTQYEIDGKKFYKSQINKEPEKFFTPEILDQIDAFCKKKFMYGQHEDENQPEEAADEQQ